MLALPNSSVLPNFVLLTNSELDSLEITNEEITDILTSLNIKKAYGPDNISVNMIKLCGKDLAVPLKLIFDNILRTGIFPKQ